MDDRNHEDPEMVSAGYNRLDTRMSSLETDVHNLSNSVERVVQSVDSLRATVNASSSTNWSVIGTWTAVLLTMVGGLGSLAIMPMRERILTLETEAREHEKMDGHPTAITKFKALEESSREVKIQIEKSIDKLDAALQREMRDLDTSTSLAFTEKLEALDKLLQTEIVNVNNILNEKAKVQDRVLAWMKDHDERVLPLNANQNARLDALEQEMDRIFWKKDKQ